MYIVLIKMLFVFLNYNKNYKVFIESGGLEYGFGEYFKAFEKYYGSSVF